MLKSQLRAAKNKQKAQDLVKDQKNDTTETSTTPPRQSNTPNKKKAEAVAPLEASDAPPKLSPPRDEMALLTLIGQREKMCRDDLTAMMVAGEESLRMLIKEPSPELIDFVKANLNDEDTLLTGIPRYEIPKADFESQVLREMRIVLRENAQKIADRSRDELMEWAEFEVFYGGLDNFDYPHKDKLLEFIKYFFLDHVESKSRILMNYMAFKEHMLSKKPVGMTPEKSRNGSNVRSGRRSAESSGSGQQSAEDNLRRRLLATNGSEDDKLQDEERMLDIAEQCFMRIADFLHLIQRTVRQVFLRYSQPEHFKDGTVLELMSPRGFLEGVRDIGFDDVTELEASCLMKVLAKPELDNAVILNEFVLIMENFGVPVLAEEDEYENDYVPDSDTESVKAKKAEEENAEKAEKEGSPEKREGDKKGEEGKGGKEKAKLAEPSERLKRFAEPPKGRSKNAIVIKFEEVDEKGMKILKKLARFLLERYMHPREFFGPTIKKEVIGKKKCKVEVIKHHDFYLRLKLASIRKKLKESASLNAFFAIDGDKYPGLIQVKRMIKALEVVAEGEQEQLIKEQEAREKEEKDKLEREAEERASKGLPPLTDEEREQLKQKEAEDKRGKSRDLLEGKKGAGGLDEVLRIGGKTSPKGGEREPKNRFASHGPHTQLNTIEEDLHETQTSHYSYQVKEGEFSDREGSRHQLSTSNHLRNSAALNELDDSTRRSGQGKGSLPLGASVGSGDYSGGSHSSSKKPETGKRDIDSNDFAINEFIDSKKRKSEMHGSTDRTHNVSDSLRKYSIKEEQEGEDISPRHKGGTRTQEHHPKKAPEEVNLEENLDYNSDREEEQRIEDELAEEADKKYIQQLQEHRSHMDDNDDYEDDEFEDKKHSRVE